MADQDPRLDPEFIEAQRERLEALREEIVQSSRDVRDDAEEILDDPREKAGDFADRGAQAQRWTEDDSMQAHEQQRLAEVDRALQKIADGTYGLSEESGEIIGRERLEAKPEAVLTLEEERRREHPPAVDR